MANTPRYIDPENRISKTTVYALFIGSIIAVTKGCNVIGDTEFVFLRSTFGTTADFRAFRQKHPSSTRNSQSIAASHGELSEGW